MKKIIVNNTKNISHDNNRHCKCNNKISSSVLANNFR